MTEQKLSNTITESTEYLTINDKIRIMELACEDATLSKSFEERYKRMLDLIAYYKPTADKES